ncbi:hypothetical protein [Parasitella parasitica]|uniref:Zinc finger PHD-type domain-containing protein n=1 Tax=Parasitella parasitica TaxID=35722 RepID=A0A0B7MPY1_9FUNG|nr:hypothetical protein [Parasitella parasitica]
MIAPVAPVRKIATVSRRKQKIPDPVIIIEQDEDGEEEDDETAEDESITRCVCGESRKLATFVFYANASAKNSSSDSLGLMVCCDECEVWQHCECMGLEKEEIPDEYFCELCRPSDHIEVKSYDKTRRYYKPCLPVTAEVGGDKKTAKRRTTLNSREASISLEEVLAFRNAIEQSKNYGASDTEITTSQVQVQQYDAMLPMDESMTIVQNYDQVKRPKRASPKKFSAEEQPKPNKKEKKTQRRYTPRTATNNSSSSPKSVSLNTPSSTRRHTNKASCSQTSAQQAELQTPSSGNNHQLFGHFSRFARETTPPAKVRLPSQRMTMSEMNKRASQILEYICSMQVELATKRKRHGVDSDSEEDDDEEEVCKRRQLVSAKMDQVMAFVGANIDDDNRSSPKETRRPTPILMSGKLDRSSHSSSLSSASTIPLDDIAYQHEKSIAQDALQCRKEPSSMELMDNLTSKVITFQRRFGSLDGFNLNDHDEEDGPVTRSSHYNRW